MNQIQKLRLMIAKHFPDASFVIEGPPIHKTGSRWMDINLGKRGVTIEWRPRKGFGISRHKKNPIYGEGPDIVCRDLDSTFKQISCLLKP